MARRRCTWKICALPLSRSDVGKRWNLIREQYNVRGNRDRPRSRCIRNNMISGSGSDDNYLGNLSRKFTYERLASGLPTLVIYRLVRGQFGLARCNTYIHLARSGSIDGSFPIVIHRHVKGKAYCRRTLVAYSFVQRKLTSPTRALHAKWFIRKVLPLLIWSGSLLKEMRNGFKRKGLW